MLQAIKLRYAQKEIYTYSGIVLIATNPFARVDSLYVPGMVQVYAGKHRASQAPHLFAIAEEAFAYVTASSAFAMPCISILTQIAQGHAPRQPQPDHRRVR